MPKKFYPGGFRLTLKQAQALAVQEFGTCKGLKKCDWQNSDGFFEMILGDLEIEIHPDMGGSGCIMIAISMHGAPGHIFSSTTGTHCTAIIKRGRAAAEGTQGGVRDVGKR